MRIGFSMPAYNEELLLAETVDEVAPLVEAIAVVDDGSRDRTPVIADALAEKHRGKVMAIHHPKNRGAGAAVITGVRALLERDDLDAIGLIGADAQCDPALIPCFRKILDDHPDIDVAKGSRFLHPQTLHKMPRFRYWGNRGVSAAMQLVLGYSGMSDILHGYLVARRRVFAEMDLSRIADGYDLENTMMAEFRRLRCAFGLVPSPSRYGRETSKIVYRKQIPTTIKKAAMLWAERVSSGPLRDRLTPILLASSVVTGGATLPIAALVNRATSPRVHVFPGADDPSWRS